MTRSEYQDLVGFLGKKFDAIDRRFDGNDERFDGIEGRLAKIEVGLEENRHQIQTVAEGLTSLREEMGREFVAVRAEMREGFHVQGRAFQDLSTRLDRWEARAL